MAASKNQPTVSCKASLWASIVILSTLILSIIAPPMVLADNTWTSTGSLNTGRSGHTATLLTNGKVLATGGGFWYDPEDIAYPFRSTEVYDPLTRQWTETGPVNVGRSGHTATLLPNGKVLVAGGFGPHYCGMFNFPCSLQSAELYDPAHGTWALTGDMGLRGFGNHTATLLPNGKVLVAGGDAFKSTEIYDPAAGTWSATADLNIARSGHTATLLPNCRVLVAGGSGEDGFLNSAELYGKVAKISGAPGLLLLD